MSRFGAMVEGHSNSRIVVERIRELALAEGWEVINARAELNMTMTIPLICPDNVPSPAENARWPHFAFENIKSSVALESSPKIIFIDHETWNDGGFVRSKFTVGCHTIGRV